MNETPDHARLIYVAFSAIAGAVTSLSFMPWKTLRWAEIGMTLFVGSAFATFAVPYLVGDIASIEMTSLRSVCFFTYVGATGANVFIPVIIRSLTRWLNKLFGTEDGK